MSRRIPNTIFTAVVQATSLREAGECCETFKKIGYKIAFSSSSPHL